MDAFAHFVIMKAASAGIDRRAFPIVLPTIILSARMTESPAGRIILETPSPRCRGGNVRRRNGFSPRRRRRRLARLSNLCPARSRRGRGRRSSRFGRPSGPCRRGKLLCSAIVRRFCQAEDRLALRVIARITAAGHHHANDGAGFHFNSILPSVPLTLASSSSTRSFSRRVR